MGTVKRLVEEEEEIWTFWRGERNVAEEAATTVGAAEETRRGDATEREVEGLGKKRIEKIKREPPHHQQQQQQQHSVDYNNNNNNNNNTA